MSRTAYATVPRPVSASESDANPLSTEGLFSRMKIVPRVADTTPVMETSVPTPAEAERLSIRRAKAGDPAAFAPLVVAHQDKLYRFVLRITRNEHDAQDVTQKAFINAWRHISRFDESRPFSNWLFGIAYKDAVKLVTRRKPTTEMPELMADDDVSPDEFAARSETPVWDMARRELSVERYAMLRLHYADGVPVAEIARITGRSVVSVKVHLFRARGILRDKLAAEGPSRGIPGNLPLSLFL